MMLRLQVVTVTKDIKKYSQFSKDSKEFPNLVEFVEGEFETFIVDERDGGFWTTDEFFHCTEITHFVVDSQELLV